MDDVEAALVDFNAVQASPAGEGRAFAVGEGIGVYLLPSALDEHRKLKPWARYAMDRMPEKVLLVEEDPSRTGLHVWISADESKPQIITDETRHIERYTKDYIVAVTGRKYFPPEQAQEPATVRVTADAEVETEPAPEPVPRVQAKGLEAQLEALSELLWGSLHEVEPSRRAALAREYRSTVEAIEQLSGVTNQEKDPLDELAARRNAKFGA